MRLDMVEMGVFYRLMECVRAEYGLTTKAIIPRFVDLSDTAMPLES